MGRREDDKVMGSWKAFSPLLTESSDCEWLLLPLRSMGCRRVVVVIGDWRLLYSVYLSLSCSLCLFVHFVFPDLSGLCICYHYCSLSWQHWPSQSLLWWYTHIISTCIQVIHTHTYTHTHIHAPPYDVWMRTQKLSVIYSWWLVEEWGVDVELGRMNWGKWWWWFLR